MLTKGGSGNNVEADNTAGNKSHSQYSDESKTDGNKSGLCSPERD